MYKRKRLLEHVLGTAGPGNGSTAQRASRSASVSAAFPAVGNPKTKKLSRRGSVINLAIRVIVVGLSEVNLFAAQYFPRCCEAFFKRIDWKRKDAARLLRHVEKSK